MFVSGCEAKCKGCHNPQTWDFNYGKKFTENTVAEIIESLKNPHVKNLVISGGEPLHNRNVFCISELCKLVKRETNKTIIVYTGMTLQELKIQYPYLSCLSYVDYLIDGRFDKDNVTEKLEKRGSKNQKCYKIKHYGVTNVAVDITDSYF